ncbi:MAG: bifunctional UDP-N-acetylglucosamine diphosphorylase/glucosamine-1-phosphate N-acetyltransferase GlmU [Planctomycetota bacterium]|jgi:bifunctional UDP-N-acetylglucosamine pyrophosphorylase/glucosamine-1-phosphate N-acetyltransferase
MAEWRAIVLAAGKGVRMKSDLPKVVHPACGRPMVLYVINAAMAVGARPAVVIGYGREHVEKILDGLDVDIAIQEEQLGTGHAVMAARDALEDYSGNIIVLCGDVPLMQPDSLEYIMKAHEEKSPAATIVTCQIGNPNGYGRVIRTQEGSVQKVVEHSDTSELEKRINEINTGIFAFSSDSLWSALDKIKPENEQQEYYLPDVIPVMLEKGEKVEAVKMANAMEFLGVNDRAQLAEATAIRRKAILARHMSAGVTIVDPSTIYIEEDVEIGADTVVHPFTIVSGPVKIGKHCQIGPFSHIRAGTEMHDRSEIGNFCEAKKTIIGEGSKAKHLSYLGDGIIGKKANIGAGTIFANYDGKNKNQTTIEDGAHIGSGTVFVAPSRAGKNTVTGAGAIVTKNTSIPDNETYFGIPAVPMKEFVENMRIIKKAKKKKGAKKTADSRNKNG